MSASVAVVSAMCPVLARVAHPFAGEERFDVEEVVGPACDIEQCGHRCHLLDLVLEEPEHELFAQRVVSRPGRGEKFLDAVRDLNLLGEGEDQRFLR